MKKNNLDNAELTKTQRLAGNLTAGFFIIACGIFLLLVGVKVIPLNVYELIVPSLLATVGLVLGITGLIQINTVSLWCSFAFLVPSIVSLLVVFTPLKYSQLYPMYIAIPAIASLFTMLMSREFSDHLKVILLFGVLALIFFLASFKILHWAVILPLLVVFIGLIIVYVAVKSAKNEENE